MYLDDPLSLVVVFLRGYARKACVVEKNLRCEAEIEVKATSFNGGYTDDNKFLPGSHSLSSNIAPRKIT
jgi:hypothetical protein